MMGSLCSRHTAAMAQASHTTPITTCKGEGADQLSWSASSLTPGFSCSCLLSAAAAASVNANLSMLVKLVLTINASVSSEKHSLACCDQAGFPARTTHRIGPEVVGEALKHEGQEDIGDGQAHSQAADGPVGSLEDPAQPGVEGRPPGHSQHDLKG